MTEVKGADNCEDGVFNAGKLWKLRKKLSPRNRDPPIAMYNDSGKLLTTNEEIVREAELHYEKALCLSRLKECMKTKTPE